MPNLAETLAEVRRRIHRVGTRSMNEEKTKVTQVDPVLRALHGDVKDVDEVQREFEKREAAAPQACRLRQPRATSGLHYQKHFVHVLETFPGGWFAAIGQGRDLLAEWDNSSSQHDSMMPVQPTTEVGQ